MPKKTASQEQLELLHAALAKALREKVESGTATAADLSAAAKFLKDNHIEAIPEEGDDLDKLRKGLPDFSADEIAEEDQTYN